jgi:plasmid stabilization system protein ParE
MGVTVRFAPRALADLESIRSYLVPRSPRGAERVRQAIEAAIDVCAENPRLGVPCDLLGLYRWPLRRYRYTIFYRALGDADGGIEVARIVHSARVKRLSELPDD